MIEQFSPVSLEPIQESPGFNAAPSADAFLESMLQGGVYDIEAFVANYDKPQVARDQRFAEELPDTVIPLFGDTVFPQSTERVMQFNAAAAAFTAELVQEEALANVPENVVAHPALKERFQKYTLDDFSRVKTELQAFKEQYGDLYDRVVGDLMGRASQLAAMCGGHSHDSSNNSTNSTNSIESSSFLNHDDNHDHCPTCGAEKGSCFCSQSSFEDTSKKKAA
ncbi:MAG: hypothetical protein HYV40_04485 [Candidatus Levybacteria bacterium]|nr:hypothetical protein [Candidatus Levybacteria bacterium]